MTAGLSRSCVIEVADLTFRRKQEKSDFWMGPGLRETSLEMNSIKEEMTEV